MQQVNQSKKATCVQFCGLNFLEMHANQNSLLQKWAHI